MNQQEKLVEAKLREYFAQSRADYVYPDAGNFTISSSYYKRPAVIIDIKDMSKAEANTLLYVLNSFLKHNPNADLFNPNPVDGEDVNFVGAEIKHKSTFGGKVTGFIFICGEENFNTLRSRGLYPKNREKKINEFLEYSDDQLAHRP
jgi:hypothetical protein